MKEEVSCLGVAHFHMGESTYSPAFSFFLDNSSQPTLAPEPYYPDWEGVNRPKTKTSNLK